MKNLSKLACIAGLAVCPAAFAQDLCDGFECYNAGSDIVGQGGWEVWDSGGTHATISTAQAHTGTKSMREEPFSDIVYQFAHTTGTFELNAWTFTPSSQTLDGFFIILNSYPGPSYNWSMQVRFGPGDSTVESQFDGATTALITDRWVQFRAVIDLDNNLMDLYYDNMSTPFVAGLIYSENVSGGGAQEIAALDIYSNGIDDWYIDDVSLLASGEVCEPPCMGCDDCDGDTVCDEDEDDCNNDGDVDDCDANHCPADLAAPFGGVLNVFDFLAFQTAFGNGESCADLAAPFGVLNVFDFLAFQTAFGNGC